MATEEGDHVTPRFGLDASEQINAARPDPEYKPQIRDRDRDREDEIDDEEEERRPPEEFR